MKWLDARTLPPGSPGRLRVALNCREGVDPGSAIADWGDYEEDYPNTYVNQDHNKGVDNYYRWGKPIEVEILGGPQHEG